MPGTEARPPRRTDWVAPRASLMPLALAVLLAVAGLRYLIAEPSEAAWATCLWRDVPTSTANWLAMDVPGSRPGYGEPVPAELLKARLLGACASLLAPVGRPLAATPDWPALHDTLAARRPAHVAEDSSDPRAFVCEVSFANDRPGDVAEYDWGFGDFNTGPVIGRRGQSGNTRLYGQPLSAANSVRFCRLIGPDGRPGRDRFQRAPLPDRPVR